MNLQRLMSQTRKAIDVYELIEENDKIAIGISGGKDSLALLYAMNGLKKYYPKKFTIYAVTVDLGFDNIDFGKIREICNSLDIPYECIKTEISTIVFHERNETNPCSLCAKMRKGALNVRMKELGCNKIAYAHHKDDVINTMLLSLFYGGRFHTFSPKTYMDDVNLTVIRPFVFTYEADIIGFINKYNVPVLKSPCPVDGHTKREYTKQLLKQIAKENPGVKERIFSAIKKDLL